MDAAASTPIVRRELPERTAITADVRPARSRDFYDDRYKAIGAGAVAASTTSVAVLATFMTRCSPPRPTSQRASRPHREPVRARTIRAGPGARQPVSLPARRGMRIAVALETAHEPTRLAFRAPTDAGRRSAVVASARHDALLCRGASSSRPPAPAWLSRRRPASVPRTPRRSPAASRSRCRSAS